MKNVALLTENGAFALLFRPHPGGIWQLKSPHPREFAIQGPKNANARGSAREGGGGGGWAQVELTDALNVMKIVNENVVQQGFCLQM